MDPIKESFNKVKTDVSEIKTELNAIKQKIEELTRTLQHIQAEDHLEYLHSTKQNLK